MGPKSLLALCERGAEKEIKSERLAAIVFFPSKRENSVFSLPRLKWEKKPEKRERDPK